LKRESLCVLGADCLQIAPLIEIRRVRWEIKPRLCLNDLVALWIIARAPEIGRIRAAPVVQAAAFASSMSKEAMTSVRL
jgi:hypothetical protein